MARAARTLSLTHGHGLVHAEVAVGVDEVARPLRTKLVARLGVDDVVLLPVPLTCATYDVALKNTIYREF